MSVSALASLPKLSWMAYLSLPAAKIASGLFEISSLFSLNGYALKLGSLCATRWLSSKVRSTSSEGFKLAGFAGWASLALALLASSSSSSSSSTVKSFMSFRFWCLCLPLGFFFGTTRFVFSDTFLFNLAPAELFFPSTSSSRTTVKSRIATTSHRLILRVLSWLPL